MFTGFLIALATPVAEAPVRHATVQGIDVEYRAATVDGVRIIEGKRLDTGTAFHFEARGNGRITGTVGNRRVRFADPR